MQLFKSSKDFQLDKNTFTNLRWIALLGQFAAINYVKLILDFDFYYLVCNFVVGIGVLTNLLLQFRIKQNQLNIREAKKEPHQGLHAIPVVDKVEC